MMSGGLLHERGWIAGSSEWYTPPHVFEALGIEFDLDPAAPPGGVPWIPARRCFTREDDGLRRQWRGRVWLNPPYGRETRVWLRRLADHGDGVALVFARTDTAWFRESTPRATAICFIAGRLRFVPGDGRGERSTAGAPSLLLAYGLPCAMAVAQSGLGQTFLVPRASS
jgi:DNA N-6-adenine-methyltransferase Dam